MQVSFLILKLIGAQVRGFTFFYNNLTVFKQVFFEKISLAVFFNFLLIKNNARRAVQKGLAPPTQRQSAIFRGCALLDGKYFAHRQARHLFAARERRWVLVVCCAQILRRGMNSLNKLKPSSFKFSS